VVKAVFLTIGFYFFQSVAIFCGLLGPAGCELFQISFRKAVFGPS